VKKNGRYEALADEQIMLIDEVWYSLKKFTSNTHFANNQVK